MFAAGLEHFESQGHNLYRRMLLEPSDAETLIIILAKSGQRRMIMLASNNYLGLTTHPKVVEAAQRPPLLYGTGLGQFAAVGRHVSGHAAVGSTVRTVQRDQRGVRVRDRLLGERGRDFGSGRQARRGHSRPAGPCQHGRWGETLGGTTQDLSP